MPGNQNSIAPVAGDSGERDKCGQRVVMIQHDKLGWLPHIVIYSSRASLVSSPNMQGTRH